MQITIAITQAELNENQLTAMELKTETLNRLNEGNFDLPGLSLDVKVDDYLLDRHALDSIKVVKPTAEQKAIKWITENLSGGSLKGDVDITHALTVLLKEQDRDTRHACAEAVLGTSVSEAHDIIMNTRAV